MYKLPSDFDTAFLIGKTLEMVCFSANQIFLHFDRNVSITIEGSALYRRGPREVEHQIDVPVTESNLMFLLERSIVSATADSSGTLTISFDNGAVFKCLDKSPNYESYQIANGDNITIV